MPQRGTWYDLRQEEDGTWTVFDVFTVLPVVISSTITNGLDVEEVACANALSTS
ncbi:hypothetical protein LJR231_005451 [Phyllobacterium sp. LjRoot231]|uniref:hypothetical protein n=1 Tax=Phyllobacterium sp. LjRoot231 TaxID=3342289 RepID=UPI003ECEEC6F